MEARESVGTPRFYKIKQAALLLNLSPSTLQRAIRAGEFPAIKVRGRYVVPAKAIDRMGPEVMAAILPRVFPQMLAEVYAHQDAGRETFIVSAAGNGVVETLADVLGMTGGIGTRYEIDEEDNFTGRLEGPFVYGPGKVEAMEEFAALHGIDLAASYAYSDSLSDLPMLRAVGNPVAVNPDPPLAEIARAEGWQTLRFERLGRRLVALAVTLLATVAGFGASRVAARRRVPAPRRFPVRAGRD